MTKKPKQQIIVDIFEFEWMVNLDHKLPFPVLKFKLSSTSLSFLVLINIFFVVFDTQDTPQHTLELSI